MEGFKVFNHDLSQINEHWLQTYSNVLLVLSKVKDSDMVQFMNFDDYPNSDSTESVYQFMYSNGIYLEGYTLKVVTEWIISYAKYITAKNKALEIDSKKKKLSEMKAEILKLECEIEKLENN